MSGSYTNTDGRTETFNAGAAHDTGLYDPNRHDNQIVAVFADRAAASRARDALLGAGIPQDAVETLEGAAGDAAPGASHAEDRNQEVGIWGAIKNLFAPEQEHGGYREALGRGHAMVVVTPTPQTDRHRAIQVLEASEPIDFDAKLAEWRQSAYDETGAPRSTAIGRSEPAVTSGGAGTGSGADAAAARLPPMPARGTQVTEAVSVPDAPPDSSPHAPAPPYGAPLDKARELDRERQASLGANASEAARVVEERFRPGWRERPQGAVRVRSYVAERRSPASAQPGAASSDVGPLT